MTIAQQLKIEDFPFIIKDKNNNDIYCEQSDNSWEIFKYDDDCIQIYYENSDGFIIAD